MEKIASVFHLHTIFNVFLNNKEVSTFHVFHIFGKKNSLYPLNNSQLIDLSALNTAFLHPVHCVKNVCIRIYSGPHFPVFRPNAGKCGPD